MFTVYVLRSMATGGLYTGYTSDMAYSIEQHNHDINAETKGRGPWRLVYQEQYKTRTEAMSRERFLASEKGREELKRLLTRGRVIRSAR